MPPDLKMVAQCYSLWSPALATANSDAPSIEPFTIFSDGIFLPLPIFEGLVLWRSFRMPVEKCLFLMRIGNFVSANIGDSGSAPAAVSIALMGLAGDASPDQAHLVFPFFALCLWRIRERALVYLNNGHALCLPRSHYTFYRRRSVWLVGH